MNITNLTLVEIVWSDDKISRKYIERLSFFLNPDNDSNITTPMWNKEILPGLDKTNTYNRFMIVFDYDINKNYQKCFSFSSPKNNDSFRDLTFYKLPTLTKIMLNSPIEIPTQYLSKANLEKMKTNETNLNVKENLNRNIRNLQLVKKYKNEIIYQYQCIKYNTDRKSVFDFKDVQNAHNKMIDEYKVEKFCKEEVKLLSETDKQEESKNKIKQIMTS